MAKLRNFPLLAILVLSACGESDPSESEVAINVPPVGGIQFPDLLTVRITTHAAVAYRLWIENYDLSTFTSEFKALWDPTLVGPFVEAPLIITGLKHSATIKHFLNVYALDGTLIGGTVFPYSGGTQEIWVDISASGYTVWSESASGPWTHTAW